MFGAAIECSVVTVRRRRWWPLQPRGLVMAPCGHIHFAADCTLYRDDFAGAPLALRGLFLHEMTHVWQSQQRGSLYLPTHRHPFCRYSYRLIPGRRFTDYGIEQQAEIVRHVWLARNGSRPSGAGDAGALERLLPFEPISDS